ncbi:putative selenoprotein F/M [Helianthus annuus]|uniref:Selenoprotein F/M n=1 Tax=Helianthus annuus TaxID=4232 RepID=A0A9K3HRR4_HELAN|nr:putative selenoprotein F/M [Helianthus annuus]
MSVSSLYEVFVVYHIMDYRLSTLVLSWRVCMRKLMFYPEVVSFIEDVKVEYVFNAPPKLIMLDDAGQHKETTRGVCCLVFICLLVILNTLLTIKYLIRVNVI